MVRPAERSDANGTISRAGNRRSRIPPSIGEPTGPVAPTTATRGKSFIRRPPGRRSSVGIGEAERPCSRGLLLSAFGLEAERRMERPHGLGHLLGADHAGNLD